MTSGERKRQVCINMLRSAAIVRVLAVNYHGLANIGVKLDYLHCHIQKIVLALNVREQGKDDCPSIPHIAAATVPSLQTT
jgi:hypothetical protein